jgi:hypothetical protein
MRKQVITATTAIVLGIAAGISGAMAAETGTKTMPDSSVNPPTFSPVFNYDVRHRYHQDYCYLPSEPCDNEHRMSN